MVSLNYVQPVEAFCVFKPEFATPSKLFGVNNPTEDNTGQVSAMEQSNFDGISAKDAIRTEVSRYSNALLAAQSLLVSYSVAHIARADTPVTSYGSHFPLSQQRPRITDKVYMTIRIANYTEESVGKNKPGAGSGRIVFGLYGQSAPQSCKLFLDVIKSDGESTPSYYNSQFSRINEDGLLELERVRSLNIIELAGQEQYEYAGNLMPYSPILENTGLSHDR